jgi:hypothetical protein
MISYFGAVPGVQGYIVVKLSNILMELFYGKYTGTFYTSWENHGFL